jgi:hypothetical protein
VSQLEVRPPEEFMEATVDRTLHAGDGAALYACVNWNQASIVLVQLDRTPGDQAMLERANARGLELVVELPVAAIQESAWSAFQLALRPLLEEAKTHWRPMMGGSGAHFRGQLSAAGEEIQRQVIEKILTIEPGEDALTPIEPERYLRESAAWDPAKFTFTVDGLGVIGPEPKYEVLQEMALRLPQHARERGCVLTDDGHYALVALAEHAFCEYTDPANYSVEVQAEAAALGESLLPS